MDLATTERFIQLGRLGTEHNSSKGARATGVLPSKNRAPFVGVAEKIHKPCGTVRTRMTMKLASLCP